MRRRFGVLFVCTGNICRSPTAEGVFRHFATQAGRLDELRIDSAGTIDYHTGSPPDRRAVAAALKRGYDLRDLRARQVEPADLERFDLVLAMDRGHLLHLERLAGGRDVAGRIGLFLDFAEGVEAREVPDPYHGPERGFEAVLDLVEAGARGLLAHVRERLP